MRYALVLIVLFVTFGSAKAQEPEEVDPNDSCKGVNTKEKFGYNWFRCLVLGKNGRNAICHSGKVQKEHLLRRIYSVANSPLAEEFQGRVPDYKELKEYTFNSKPGTEPFRMRVGFNFYLDAFANDYFRLNDKFPATGRTLKQYIYGDELEIICEGKPKSEALSRLDDFDKKIKTLGKSMRMRQDVSELLVTDLKKAKAARFSFSADNQKKEDITSIDAAVGYIFTGSVPTHEAGPSIGFNIIPFLYHKSISGSAGARSDIDVFMPGVLAGIEYGELDGSWGFGLDVAAAPIVDSKQKSEMYNLTVRFAPTFGIGDTSIFGEEHNIGLFGITFIARAIAKLNYIQESGTNPNFSDIDEFTTAGFEGKIIIAGRDGVPILENFTFIVEYSNLDNTAGVRDVERTAATLSYSPSDAKNFTIDLGYVEGADLSTLQIEEKWTASLGLRF